MFALGLFWLAENRFEGYEYAVSDTQATWSDAVDACAADNAALATVNTLAVDSFLSYRFTAAWSG